MGAIQGAINQVLGSAAAGVALTKKINDAKTDALTAQEKEHESALREQVTLTNEANTNLAKTQNTQSQISALEAGLSKFGENKAGKLINKESGRFEKKENKTRLEYDLGVAKEALTNLEKQRAAILELRMRNEKRLGGNK